MKVKINEILYDDVQWNENGFNMETAMSLGEIEQAFTPGVNTDIEVYDGNVEIARYYNKGINSIRVSSGNPRIVNIQFNLTQIQNNAEAEINERIDDSDGAIMDLAEMVSEMQETMETIEAFNERAAEIEYQIRGIHRSIQSILERLDALEPHNVSNEEE